MFIFEFAAREWVVLLVCAVIALLVVVVTQHLRIRDLGREVHDAVRHAQELEVKCRVRDVLIDNRHEMLSEYYRLYGEVLSEYRRLYGELELEDEEMGEEVTTYHG